MTTSDKRWSWIWKNTHDHWKGGSYDLGSSYRSEKYFLCYVYKQSSSRNARKNREKTRDRTSWQSTISTSTPSDYSEHSTRFLHFSSVSSSIRSAMEKTSLSMIVMIVSVRSKKLWRLKISWWESEFNPRAIFGMISGTKGEWLYHRIILEELIAISPPSFSKSIRPMLENSKKKMHWISMISFCFRNILDIPEVLEYFHNRFEYFMVDEYQDTNGLQYEMIRILASKTKNLCVVGDDWQGSYGKGREQISKISFPSERLSNRKGDQSRRKLSIYRNDQKLPMPS